MRWIGGALLAISAVVTAAPALAEEPAGKVVLLADEGQAVEAGRAAFALRRQLADTAIGVDVILERELAPDFEKARPLAEEISRADGVLMVLWCDFVTAENAFLFLSTRPQDERLVVRGVDPTRDGPDGRFEALAVIVRSTLDAVIDAGEPLASAGSGAPRPTPAPTPVAPPTGAEGAHAEVGGGSAGRSRFAAGVDYALLFFSREALLAHGAEAALGALLPHGLSVRAGYGLAPSIRASTDGARLTLFVHAISLGVAADRAFGAFTLGGQLGAQIGLFAKKVEVLGGSGLTLEDHGTDATFALEARVRLGYRLGARGRIITGPGVAYTARNVDYGVTVDGVRRVILAPFTFRPFWFLGVELFFG